MKLIRRGLLSHVLLLLCCPANEANEEGLTLPVIFLLGCPANEANEEGLTPQKIAKTEGFKDVMKEVKKLGSFQDKVARGAKPKGFAEPWCVRVRLYHVAHVRMPMHMIITISSPVWFSTFLLPVYLSSTLFLISLPLSSLTLRLSL